MNPNYNEQLLQEFASRFLGYGSLESKLWLIGPEAGGGEEIGEVYQRASVWSERGKKETEDLHSFHAALKLPSKFDWKRNIQPTWGPLIRVILALEGKIGETGTEDVRKFQKLELGRGHGQNCVLDLSPLSSPSKSKWKLNEFGFEWLKTRKRYEEQHLVARCSTLCQKLALHKPTHVIFYGLEQKHWWEQISESQFSASRVDHLSLVRADNTLFAMIPHPVNLGHVLRGKGAVKRFLADVGAALRESYDGRGQAF